MRTLPSKPTNDDDDERDGEPRRLVPIARALNHSPVDSLCRFNCRAHRSLSSSSSNERTLTSTSLSTSVSKHKITCCCLVASVKLNFHLSLLKNVVSRTVSWASTATKWRSVRFGLPRTTTSRFWKFTWIGMTGGSSSTNGARPWFGPDTFQTLEISRWSGWDV